MVKIDEIIKKIDRLRPVSHIGQKVMEISSNPNSSSKDLVDVIKYDQNITVNLLKICNSAYFGLKKEIVSINQAVAYLGIDKVANLAMMENSSENFTEAQKGYDLNEGDLWRYSVSSSLIAQDLAEKKQLKNISLIFTSALLKDIGKVILNDYIQDASKKIFTLVQKKGLDFLEAEREIIGIDHAELGGRVAAKWNLSPDMINIILHHHEPDGASSDDPAIPIVYLADSICMMIGVGVGADGLAYRYNQNVVDRLGFSEIDIQMTIADFWEKLRGVEEMLNLAGGVS